MFGSELAALVVADVLGEVEAVQETTQGRAYNLAILPQSANTPALIHHPVTSRYGGPISGPATEETLTYVVELIASGMSTDPIWEAAEAQHEALDGNTFDIARNGEHYTVSFSAIGESIPTTVYEDGTYYRKLGTTYETQVVQG